MTVINFATATVEGYVYLDVDGDGAFGGSEIPIPGVEVSLTSADGYVERVTTTDADGRYLFETLPSGDYLMMQTQPSGYSNGQETIGSEGGSNPAPNQISITLSPSSEAQGYHFGESGTGYLGISLRYLLSSTYTAGYSDVVHAPVVTSLDVDFADSTPSLASTTVGEEEYSIIVPPVVPLADLVEPIEAEGSLLPTVRYSSWTQNWRRYFGVIVEVDDPDEEPESLELIGPHEARSGQSSLIHWAQWVSNRDDVDQNADVEKAEEAVLTDLPEDPVVAE